MRIGQTVITPLGWGVIAQFERITSVSAPVEHPATFAAGDRIGVKLDEPSNWVCHTENSGYPFFNESEVAPLKD